MCIACDNAEQNSANRAICFEHITEYKCKAGSKPTYTGVLI